MPNSANRESVERRAYELYLQRGRQDGHDWDDWLQAEHEILGARAAGTPMESAPIVAAPVVSEPVVSAPVVAAATESKPRRRRTTRTNGSASARP